MAEVAPQLRPLPLVAHPQGMVLECEVKLVGILVEPHHRRLIALEHVPRGKHLFRLQGREIARPTKHSVQVGDGIHLEQPRVGDEVELMRRYFWRFLDHSCDPSIRIVDREAIAVRDIAAGEGVTFHYCTTEYDMATPFECRCGSPRCMGVIRGARHLTPAQRRRLSKWMADYLRTP